MRTPRSPFWFRCLSLAALAALASLASRSARADASGPAPAVPTGIAPGQAERDEMNKPHERRSGVAMGFDLGVGLAGSSGYPNDVSKIDDPSFYSSGGLLAGRGGSFFVMGAIADYVNFGLWFGSATYTNHDFRSTGVGGGFRVEAFPLYGLYPKLRDLAVFTKFGIGSTSLEVTTSNVYPRADGVQSFIGVGAFYEWRLFDMLHGHVAAGPSLEYDVIYSSSVERHGLLAGGRIIFYGGP